jgi:hypothetical protein
VLLIAVVLLVLGLDVYFGDPLRNAARELKEIRIALQVMEKRGRGK